MKKMNKQDWLESLSMHGKPSIDECIYYLGDAFPLLYEFKTTEQDSQWHAEGDVHIHTGMVLNELAQKNKIEANNEDINKEISKILTRFPNQEKAVLEYYQKDANAVQQLKGSIIEEKTIDFILSQEFIDSKKISLKDLDKAWQKANEE